MIENKLIYFPPTGSKEWYKGLSNNKVAWRIIELKRTKWEDNEDNTQEAALTHAAHSSLMLLLTDIQTLLENNCPQDINTFKITDKTFGEISLSWYGPVLELDIDVEADGKVSYLICWTGDADRNNWHSGESIDSSSLVPALKLYTEYKELEKFHEIT
ncbi:MAG TPA: hypothetical protein VEP90_10365 [Methylomirabilota bacterium]|nr:hypothetical protein [Methylomirabilota bacterium]